MEVCRMDLLLEYPMQLFPALYPILLDADLRPSVI